VLGIDLVRAQLLLAGGATLAEAGLDPDEVPAPRGYAIQVRINAERLGADGRVLPAGGVLLAFDPPGGPGVRCDTHGCGGLELGTAYDSLLAKLVVHERSGDFAAALGRARRALGEFRIEGVDTNAALLAALLERPELACGEVHTTFVEDHLAALLAAANAPGGGRRAVPRPAWPGGAAGAPSAATTRREPSPGMLGVVSPLHGTLVAWDVAAGDLVQAGRCLGLVEAMKMQHPVVATGAGRVRSLLVAAGATVAEGECLAELEGDAAGAAASAEVSAEDPDVIRPDLAGVLARRRKLLDAARPEAVARRHGGGARTARENIEDLCDPGSFQEYGGLGIAAQRSRRSLQDLIDRTPADGMVVGTGRINGDRFPDAVARCMVLAYDYTVLAGTQGTVNHHKKDRMFELAARHRWPVVVFAEGGGGRPGDIDTTHAGSLHIPAFTRFAQLSGKVPLVAIASGRCFAGNAVLAGCCDVIIATRNVSLGMGGPAMIEGGGLGVFHADEVGPVRVQQPNGVIDIVVEDEAGAVRVARRYLSYFQGALAHWRCADQRRLRAMVPANRLRAYDVRPVLHTLADEDSVLELRPVFALNMVTALARIEGRPIGVIANDPMHLGGAIDAAAADKAARFLQLSDAFGLPVVSLCDTPGNMVGPEAERTALVRHCCRLYVVGANVGVPIVSVVLRKAYGLGAQAMVGGSFHRPVLSVAWPTGEFGPMNLEGAVRLGYRKELEAIADPAARAAAFERMVSEAHARGEALNAATLFEIDDVIDPAHTRERIVEALRSLPPAEAGGTAGRRPWVDTW
jgi:acetyl-CoA carboxylase carboxyltransferase component/biotin carboxyl carrier protein